MHAQLLSGSGSLGLGDLAYRHENSAERRVCVRVICVAQAVHERDEEPAGAACYACFAAVSACAWWHPEIAAIQGFRS